jgi:hypothetical protein
LALLVPMPAMAAGRDLSVEEFISPNDSSSYIILEKTAIGLLPPETVGGSYVGQAIWSPDGRFVVFTKASNFVTKKALEDQPFIGITEVSVGIWDSRTRNTTYVWTGKVSLLSVEWLGPNTVIVTTSQVVASPSQEDPNEAFERFSCMQANAITKKTVVLMTELNSHSLHLNISPNAPTAIMSSDIWLANRPPYFWLIGVGTCEKLYLPEGSGGYRVRWLEDGKTPCFEIYSDMSGKTLADGDKWQTFSLATKTFSEWQGKEAPKLHYHDELDLTPSPLVAVQLDTPKECAGPKLRSLWYEHTESGKKSRLLVAPDTDLYAMSPRNDAVVYRAEGALFVRRLVSLPKERVQAAIDSVQRVELQVKVKETGLSIKMFCDENYDTLPSPDDLSEKLLPYSRHKEQMDGFVYLLNGQKEADIQNPSDTIIGYYPGPGGYAVVYFDGHAKWLTELPASE